MKKILVSIATLMLLSTAIIGQSRNLNTSSKHLKIYLNQAESEWTLGSQTETDVYEIYNPFHVEKNVRFVSDVDSINFSLKNDTLIQFDIVCENAHYPTAIKVISDLPNTMSIEEKVYFLSYFWSEAKFNFVFMDEVDFSWDSLYKTALTEAIATKNDYEYYQVFKKFTASLKDGHTEVFDRGFLRYKDYVPFSVKIINNELFATSVRIPFDKIMPPGSKIIEINGLQTKDYIEKNVLPFVNSKSPSRIKMLTEFQIVSAHLITDSLHLRYITPKNETKYHVFARNGEAIRTPNDKYSGFSPERPYQSSLSWKNNIAHLNITSFNPRNLAKLDSLLDAAVSAKGLIIDLRYNGGGVTDGAFKLLERISKQNYFLTYGYQTRINDGVKRAMGNFIEDFREHNQGKAYRTELPDTVYIPDTVRKFTMPIIVLTSEYTFSAAEDFLVMMYEMNDRPTLIGTPSGGSTGSPLVITTGLIGETMPDGGFSRLCTRRVLFPYSHKPFSDGIMPDILVEYNSIDEYLSGKDKVLEVAMDAMKRKIKSR